MTKEKLKLDLEKGLISIKTLDLYEWHLNKCKQYGCQCLGSDYVNKTNEHKQN